MWRRPVANLFISDDVLVNPYKLNIGHPPPERDRHVDDTQRDLFASNHPFFFSATIFVDLDGRSYLPVYNRYVNAAHTSNSPSSSRASLRPW